MLTKADDYPIHQTPEPIAYAGTDRNFYDRYFFNGYSPDGELFFAAALGVYPHLNIMDAAFCVIHDGRQYNLHASRILHMERLDTRVGPIEIEVIEPLDVLRIAVTKNAYGIEADVRFKARVAPIEEPRFTRRLGSQLTMDLTRLTQNGTYGGHISVNGRRFELADETIWGTRDRSWGIRSVGARDTQPNPYAGEPQFYWLWAPLNFDDRATFYHLNSDADGKPWNTRGVIVPLSGQGDAIQVTDVASELTFQRGTRHASHAVITLGGRDEPRGRINLVPLFHFYMKGLGYGHPEWAHGSYHGELATGYDEFELAKMASTDSTNLHIQAFCRATLELDGQTRQGQGVLEQMVIGRHAPSGFREILDMAK
jgi:hypothetical protein